MSSFPWYIENKCAKSKNKNIVPYSYIHLYFQRISDINQGEELIQIKINIDIVDRSKKIKSSSQVEI